MRASRAVLVIESSDMAQALAAPAADRGLSIVVARTEAEALAFLESHVIDLAATDAGADSVATLELVRRIVERWPGLPVLVMAKTPESLDTAAAFDSGVFDLVPFGATLDEIGHAVDKALAHSARARGLPPPPRAASVRLFGESDLMHQARALLERAAMSRATVLIRGESGTGKELAARTVHERSDRRSAPFVKIDCASLPENLLESELFGYEKGAFTGAGSRKLGRVEIAEGGTLFLDEVGELSETVQAKLLRLLQDREINRLGGTAAIKVDVRVVAATHRDLETMVERREFRQDLFYRLNVVPIWLPPLRARRDDIELLAKHFCETAGRENERAASLSADALRHLRRQRWPGNVRQLQNFVERLVVLSTSSVIDAEAARTELSREVTFATEPASTAGESPRGAHDESEPPVLSLSEEVRLAEKRALERALEHTGGNRSRAARLLGVSRSNFYAKLDEHGLL